MKLLVAILSCEARHDRMEAQRISWVKDFQGIADVKFFLARQERPEMPDEVFLDVPDDYAGLPQKTREMVRWALAHNYDRILKTDDDTVIFPRKLRIPAVDYAGWVHRAEYVAGWVYWLTRRAMEVVAKAEFTEQKHEDRWVGAALGKAGIRAINDAGVLFFSKGYRPLPADIYKRIAPGYAAGEFDPKEIPYIYAYA
jgi:hypothetical protein